MKNIILGILIGFVIGWGSMSLIYTVHEGWWQNHCIGIRS